MPARRFALMAVGAVLATAGALALARPHAPAPPRRRSEGSLAAPCGGEALDEDTFPPLPLQPMVTPARPGGTMDAPGGPDGRPEEWVPDASAFDALLRREGTTVRMGAFTTSFAHASPSQAANIALVAKKLTGVVVPAGAVFSYNRAAGPFTASGGYGWGRMFVGNRIVPTIGGGVCQGASTLYNAVLLANLPVVERHPHGLTVPYLPPGRDATVTEEAGLDFRFRNNTGGPLVLWGEAIRRRLTLAIFGTKHPPKVEIFTEVLARTPFRTEVVRDPELPPGQEVVAAAGQDGVRARAWVVVTQPDGTTVRRDLGTHTYRPSPRVILRGPDGNAPAAPPAQ
jgi:vancomycin resistance protein VanW